MPETDPAAGSIGQRAVWNALQAVSDRLLGMRAFWDKVPVQVRTVVLDAIRDIAAAKEIWKAQQPLLREVRAGLQINSGTSIAAAQRALDALLGIERGPPGGNPDAALADAPGYGMAHLRHRARARLAQAEPIDVLLVNDTRTQNNIGCRATTDGVIAAVEAAGRKVGHSITLTELAFVAELVLPAARDDIAIDRVAADLAALPEFADYRALIARSDAVVINGEGSFYDRQAKGLVTYALAALAKEQFGKTVAIVNHSAVLDDPVMRAFADRAYAAASVVAFREPLSFAELPGALASPGMVVAADVAFGLALAPAIERTAAAPAPIFPYTLLENRFPLDCVVLGGSSALFRPDRPTFDGYGALRDLALALIDRGFPVGCYAADRADERMLSALSVELGLPFASASLPLDAVMALMRSALCYVSGRWHGSIIAASVGTPPILGEANFFKTRALHEMLALPWPMFSYHRLDAEIDGIVDTVTAIRDEGPRIRAKVHTSASAWAAGSAAWVPALRQASPEAARATAAAATVGG